MWLSVLFKAMILLFLEFVLEGVSSDVSCLKLHPALWKLTRRHVFTTLSLKYSQMIQGQQLLRCRNVRVHPQSIQGQEILVER